jgi:septal ring factor EnvC (AmiA/AmiB activator)
LPSERMQEEVGEHSKQLARLESDVKNLSDTMNRIEARLIEWQANYVPRSEISEALKARDNRIGKVEQQVQWLFYLGLTTGVGFVIWFIQKGGVL